MPEQEWDGKERRVHPRDEALVKAVVCAVRDGLSDEVNGVPREKHIAQHAFLDEWIDELRVQRERRERIKTQVMGWGIITALGSLGTMAYQGLQYLREHLK